MTASRSLLKDRRGATAVEVALLAPVVFGAVLLTMDLGVYLWRWSQAVQAARVAARVAAISDPVSADLLVMTGLETGVAAGEPVGPYARDCTAEACAGGTYDPTAMGRIFYGHDGACGDAPRRAAMGACDVMPELRLDQISVRYSDSGVDAAGMAGALRPVVSVRIFGVPSGSVLLTAAGLSGLLNLPPAEITVLAEDLRSS